LNLCSTIPIFPTEGKMRQSQQFLETADNCAQMAENAPDEPTQIAKPLRQLSCDSLARSSMILGNPTETTMGSDEKRSGDDRRGAKERRSGTDTRSENEKRLTGER
jgi:hypothetical protein